ncbi:MAG: DUF3500 domain-containing protein [Phormidesmis sp. RL_2_1]|nr:DUF3500 domain-containing protein [Phormidesmis sp. RL_2_1]
MLVGSLSQLKAAEHRNQTSLQPQHVSTQPAVRYVFDESSVVLTQSLQDVRYQEFTAAVQSFMALLTEEQKTALVQPFDDPFRNRAFCYVLARCKEEYVGLRMRDLDSAQKIAFNNVLMKGFSGSGYSRAIQTMNREWLVEETENAHRADPNNYPTVGSPLVAEWTPPPERSAPDFYIAFFGEPASMEPWGLRFEGHHLSLNLTFGGEGEQAAVGTSPMFFGSSPMIIPESPAILEEEEATPYPQWQQQEGQQLLHRETWLGRSFLQSLDAATLQAGQWSELPDVVLAGGAEVPLDADSFLAGEKAGIAVAELPLLQQSLLFEFGLEFLQLQASQNIDVEAFKANLANARVWWYGDIEDEQADLYLRVQSDRYLVEILQSNTFAVVSEVDSNHVHASFRDLTSDWDYNSLGAHIHHYHESAAVN